MSIKIKLIAFGIGLGSVLGLRAQGRFAGVRLDNRLNEISGLLILNDSLLIAHNDSGDQPNIYLIDTTGQIRKTVCIKGATNQDWEAIAMDQQRNLWIGDVGNNSNQRRNLCLYKLQADSLLFKDSLHAEKIEFAYPDQTQFPPDQTQRYFDCEAMLASNDTVYLFTKCRTEPYDGISKVYRVSFTANQAAKLTWIADLKLKNRSFRKDAVTDACWLNGKYALLTYSGIEVFEMVNEQFIPLQRIPFGRWSQKEAIAADTHGIWLADEFLRGIGGGRLYRLKK